MLLASMFLFLHTSTIRARQGNKYPCLSVAVFCRQVDHAGHSSKELTDTDNMSDAVQFVSTVPCCGTPDLCMALGDETMQGQEASRRHRVKVSRSAWPSCWHTSC